ncbi:MAG: Cna B-type domain-containing protein, partial [Kiritimatiellia bacterium]
YKKDEKVTIHVNITWQDEGEKGQTEKRPDTVTVTLYNGKAKEIVQSKPVQTRGEGANRYNFTAPKYNAEGKEITYTVGQSEAKGYKTSVGNSTKDPQPNIYNFDITNLRVGVVEVTVTKNWGETEAENKLPVTMVLTGGEAKQTSVELNGNEFKSWTHSFGKFPQFDENGKPYTYNVAETKIGKTAVDSSGTTSVTRNDGVVVLYQTKMEKTGEYAAHPTKFTATNTGKNKTANVVVIKSAREGTNSDSFTIDVAETKNSQNQKQITLTNGKSETLELVVGKEYTFTETNIPDEWEFENVTVAGKEKENPAKLTVAGNERTDRVVFTNQLKEFAVKYQYGTPTPTGAPELPTVPNAPVRSGVTVEPAPTLPGYTFSGWTTTDATIANGNFTMPANDVTLTGTWAIREDLKYTVKYYKDSAVEENHVAELDKTYENVTFGTPLKALKVETTIAKDNVPEGYQDKGTIDATNSLATITVDEEKNIVRVVLEKRTNIGYTISYYYDKVMDISTLVTGLATFEDAITYAEDVVTIGTTVCSSKVKAGYEFDKIGRLAPTAITARGVSINVYYTRITAPVVKNKTWADGGVGRPGEGDVSIALERSVALATEKDKDFNPGTPNPAITDNAWTYTWPELPTHTTDGVLYIYKMVEKENAKVVPNGGKVKIGGMTYTVSYDDAGNVTNTLDTGTLKITKALKDATAEESDAFTFTVDNVPGGFDTENVSGGTAALSGKTLTISGVKKDVPVTIKNLPVGAYTVTETGVPEGKTYTTKVDEAEKSSASVTIEKDQQATLAFTNTRTGVTEFTVKKQWVDGNNTSPD